MDRRSFLRMLSVAPAAVPIAGFVATKSKGAVAEFSGYENHYATSPLVIERFRERLRQLERNIPGIVARALR